MRPADQLKAIEMLLDHGFGRPLKHLSDDTLRLLVENARQLEESGSVVVDNDGKVVTEYTEYTE